MLDLLYFDLIPQELNIEIFKHLRYAEIKKFQTNFPLLNTSNFWLSKIYFEFPDFNFSSKVTPTIKLYTEDLVKKKFNIDIEIYTTYAEMRPNYELIYFVHKLNSFSPYYIVNNKVINIVWILAVIYSTGLLGSKYKIMSFSEDDLNKILSLPGIYALIHRDTFLYHKRDVLSTLDGLDQTVDNLGISEEMKGKDPREYVRKYLSLEV